MDIHTGIEHSPKEGEHLSAIYSVGMDVHTRTEHSPEEGEHLSAIHFVGMDVHTRTEHSPEEGEHLSAIHFVGMDVHTRTEHSPEEGEHLSAIHFVGMDVHTRAAVKLLQPFVQVNPFHPTASNLGKFPSTTVDYPVFLSLNLRLYTWTIYNFVWCITSLI